MKYNDLKTPSYIVSKQDLISNLEILKKVIDEAGCEILLAQKAFSMYSLYPLIGEYLSGTASSGLYEAKLGYEYMKKDTHTFCPAFTNEEMVELCSFSSHIIFNSLTQLETHRNIWENSNASVGIRINPEYSTQSGGIYDPCAKYSRLGICNNILKDTLPKGVEGIHIHTLCEQGFEPLKETFKHVETIIPNILNNIKWINLGGGHHITKEGYDIEGLIQFIKYIKDKYNVKVILEPGEAIALNAGTLITKVMDIINNDMKVLILDASAACHMPDVIEMPYRPPLKDSKQLNESKYNYRLSSRTCLSGDVIGDYSFDKEININDILTFEDMAIYTMVKNNTFNGMPLPSIYIEDNGNYELVKEFSYEDFKGRLS